MVSTNTDANRTENSQYLSLFWVVCLLLYWLQSLKKACRVQEAQVSTGIWRITFISVLLHFHKQFTAHRNETRSSFSTLRDLELFQKFLKFPELLRSIFCLQKNLRKISNGCLVCIIWIIHKASCPSKRMGCRVKWCEVKLSGTPICGQYLHIYRHSFLLLSAKKKLKSAITLTLYTSILLISSVVGSF